jgi:TetR/AcrR family transcriptional repressor of nem operon
MTRAPNLAARSRILEAASALFAEGGYEAVSMEKVAAAAGLKKANLFHYYPSKEALGVAVVEEAARRHAEGVAAIFADESTDPVTAVRLLFTSGGARLQQDCGGGRCLIGRLSQDVDADNAVMRRKLKACVFDWRSQIAVFLGGWKRRGYFRPRFEPLEAADAVIALYEGGLLLAQVVGTAEPAEHAERGAVTIVMSWKA